MHEYHNVSADGNCFYTALLEACGTMDIDLVGSLAIGTQRDTIDTNADSAGTQQLRTYVADQLERDPTMLNNLYDVLQTCPRLKLSYPLARDFEKDMPLSKFASSCINAVRELDVWASEVEHTLMRDVLRQHKIDLITCSITRPSELRRYHNVEETMLQLAQLSLQPFCIVLINLNHQHYLYMSLTERGIIQRGRLIKYLQRYLASCYEEEELDEQS